MFSYIRGIEYCIIFSYKNKKTGKVLDYFDIIPDLEKLTKTKLEVQNNTIIVLSTKQIDERLLKSKYYLDRKNQWFNFQTKFRNKIDDNTITLTKKEKDIINIILNKLDSHIIEYGLYDSAYIK